MGRYTIKEKLFDILQEIGKPTTERELVEAYIRKYPDFDKNYTSTKSSPKQKIRGTIQSVLKQNSNHPRIGIDESLSPYVYYLK